MLKLHVKARSPAYPGSASEVKRQTVLDELVPWSVPFADYSPPFYVDASVAAEPCWADRASDLVAGRIKFNAIDTTGAKPINRVSLEGPYELAASGMPMNPRGRTGLRGRGLMGKFGPNHAADPIVTRSLVNDDGVLVLEVVLIRRKDTGEWALPGGMVENGDTVGRTLEKEFGEEALNSLEGLSKGAKKALANIFAVHGQVVYAGYMDDHRNTDNAWIETTAVHFHDPTGNELFGQIPLHAGDDAGEVAWVPVTAGMELYADHAELLAKVCAGLRLPVY